MLIDKLIDKISELKSPIVVGLDPRLEQIPSHIKESGFKEFGKTPYAAAKIIYRYNREVIDQIYDLVPAVKPQIAMYEQYGSHGIDCYIKTITYAKSKGLLVIGDVKRGDIASTAKAYSDGHIGRVGIDGNSQEVFYEDFITVSPYLGGDSIEPFLEDSNRYGKGIFVLVKTSNPGSADIQDETLASGIPMYQHIGKLVSKWGADFIGKNGYSTVGAVVGATHPEVGRELRALMPHTFFLVPGYGAQSGTAKNLKGMLNKNGLGIIVNSSRGITGAYLLNEYKSYGEKGHAQAARAAVIDMKRELMS